MFIMRQFFKIIQFYWIIIIINSIILKIDVANKYPQISDKEMLATKIVLVLPFLNIFSKLLSAINLKEIIKHAQSKMK